MRFPDICNQLPKGEKYSTTSVAPLRKKPVLYQVAEQIR